MAPARSNGRRTRLTRSLMCRERQAGNRRGGVRRSWTGGRGRGLAGGHRLIQCVQHSWSLSRGSSPAIPPPPPSPRSTSIHFHPSDSRSGFRSEVRVTPSRAVHQRAYHGNRLSGTSNLLSRRMTRGWSGGRVARGEGLDCREEDCGNRQRRVRYKDGKRQSKGCFCEIAAVARRKERKKPEETPSAGGGKEKENT
jgi:hypothetical protein